MKKIAILIQLTGLFIMGAGIGRSINSGESNLILPFAGLFVVLAGLSMLLATRKKSTPSNPKK